MKNRNLLFIIVALVVVLTLILAIAYLSNDSEKDELSMPDHKFENWDAPIANESQVTQDALNLFSDENPLTLNEIINAAQTGRISLVSELWRLRRKCPEDMSRYDCNIRIQKFLMERFFAPDNKRIADLFTRYLKYEEAVSQMEIPRHASMKERYDLLKEKRREIFGEDADLVFGFEESRSSFREAYKIFKDDTIDLSGDERMAAYERFRREHYGQYYDSILAREPKFTKYDVEMEIRGSDLNEMGADSRTEKVQAIREEYFGKDGATRMATLDKELALQKQTTSAYETAERDFLANNPELNGEAKDKALLELRTKYMGKDEAEAYTRRMQLRAAQQKLRQQK